MTWLWTWAACRPFSGDTVYDRHDRYLGEGTNDSRRYRRKDGSSVRNSSFTPWAKRGVYANYAGYAMYTGYEDLPGPEVFS